MDNRKSKSRETFVSLFAPPEGREDLAAFLAAACRALGGRTDADLARTMGVPAAAMANWKKRGVVPADRVSWFTTTLPAKIGEYRTDLPDVGHTARAATVELLRRSGGNPLGVDKFKNYATARMLGGLLAIAEFISTLEEVDPHVMDSSTIEHVADLLEATVPTLRRSLGPAFTA